MEIETKTTYIAKVRDGITRLYLPDRLAVEKTRNGFWITRPCGKKFFVGNDLLAALNEIAKIEEAKETKE
jgi:hypothetical protein